MIPLLAAALMVRAARVLPSGQRDRVALVARRRGVVHVAVAPVTPSGRWVSRVGRTVCHTRTGRLTVLANVDGVPALDGRRVCSRCCGALTRGTDVPGLDGHPMTRDQEVEAFELLTPSHLAAFVPTLATIDETHQLGRLAMVLFGPPPMKPRAQCMPREQAVIDLHDHVRARRQRLTTAAMTAAERAQIERAREDEAIDRQRIQSTQRRGAARDRAIDRRNRGQYLMPHEREALAKGA